MKRILAVMAALGLLVACPPIGLLTDIQATVEAATAETVATPVLSPAGGEYSSDQTVSISCSTAGSTIYFTADGSTPTAQSSPYSAPIAVAGSGTRVTVKAIALAPGMKPSAVATASYTVRYDRVATPIFSPPAGVLPVGTQAITIIESTPGARVYYTTDGSTPSTSSTPYSAPFDVSGAGGDTKTIKAIAFADGKEPSPVAVATYTFSATAVSLEVRVSPSSAGIVNDYLVYPAHVNVEPGSFDITASPAAQWGFVRWEAVSGSAAFADANAASTKVTLSSASVIQAVFGQYELTVNSSNGSHGSVSPSGTLPVGHGVATPIAVTEAAGYHFVNWTVMAGSAIFASDSVILTSGPATIQANFAINQYTLSVTANSGSYGTVTPLAPILVDHGAHVPIEATPGSAYSFKNWTVSGTATFDSTGTGESTSSADFVVLTAGNAAVEAVFGVRITYDANGAGGAPPASTVVPVNQPVTVAGSADLVNPGYTFDGWNTAANGSGTQYAVGSTLTSTSNVTLYAMWNKRLDGGTTIDPPLPYTVTISGPTALHYGSQSTFTGAFGGNAQAHAWYLDSYSTLLGTAPSLAITPTVPAYSYGAHVLMLVVRDENGLSYAGSLAISVGN